MLNTNLKLSEKPEERDLWVLDHPFAESLKILAPIHTVEEKDALVAEVVVRRHAPADLQEKARSLADQRNIQTFISYEEGKLGRSDKHQKSPQTRAFLMLDF